MDLAAEIKAHVFADVIDAEIDAADPYRPAGEPAGYDPNAPLPPGVPLRKHLVKMLCSSTALRGRSPARGFGQLVLQL